MKHPVLEWRESERDCAAPFQIGAVEPAVHFTTERRGRLLDRNEIVGHVHDAANRARAVQDRCWAVHDFDALAKQRAYAWGMIRAQIGNVKKLRPIVENPDPIVRLSM